MFRLLENNSAYVASTLPVFVLNKMAEEWNVGRVLVASPALAKSYNYLRAENPSIKIVCLPQSRMLNVIYLFVHLCATRLSKRKIYFFHECCCIYFDLIIGLVKPCGVFYPQVTLDSFTKIDFSRSSLSKIKVLLLLFRLDKVFVPYLMDRDDNRGKAVIWSRINYPSTVSQYSVTVSSHIKSNGVPLLGDCFQKKILFLVGSEVFDNNTICRLYIKIVDLCVELGFQCYVKDHPNPQSRLCLTHPRLIEIDPYMPIELSDDKYDFVVGAASTALLQFKRASISILQLISDVDSELLAQRKKHITAMKYGELINFPATLEEFVCVLKSRFPCD